MSKDGKKRADHLMMGSREEAALLFKLASNCNGNILEIGVGRGGSAIYMAQGIKEGGFNGHIFTTGIDTVKHTRKNLKESGLSDFITMYKLDSTEFIQGLHEEGKTFSLAYIDGDHSYASVCNDISLVCRVLVSNGVIAFHDTNIESVVRAIEDSIPGWTLVAEAGRVKAYKNV